MATLMQTQQSLNPWGQVAGHKPKLRTHTRFYQHTYRDTVWHVLHDRTGSRHYRFTAGTMAFVERLNGTDSIQDIFDDLALGNNPDAPTQEEILTLLSQLHTADLLQGEVAASGNELAERHQQQEKAKWQQALMRPLSIKIPLIDPDRLVTRLTNSLQPIFSTMLLAFWAIIVCAGAVAAISHWQELATHAAIHALQPGNLALIFILYPLIKTLHEFGHAICAKHWGGEVHEMGVMFLVLMPVPYVDVTCANAFPNKWHRILTGAAGIMVEMWLAAAAALLWITVQPGLVQDIAFNVMIIGGVSTLLFNGNPLLRFDGYYVLTDWLEIPNLSSRSNRYLGYLVRSRVFGLQNQSSPVTVPSEKPWFIFYATTSFFYRMFISISIALFIAGKFFIVGILLAFWALSTQLVMPLVKNLKSMLLDPALQLQGKNSRAMTSVAGGTALLFIALFLIPAPTWTQAEGVVKLPETSMIRAQSDGFIVLAKIQNGTQVKQGDVLFETEDPLLTAQIEVLHRKLDELKTQKTSEFMTDRVQASIFQNQIEDASDQLGELQERLGELTLRSPVDGEFRVSRADDLPGRFVKRGQLLGHVVDFSEPAAQVVISQNSLHQVRSDTRSVEVRLAGNPGETLMANIKTETPSLSNQLPSRTLGTQGGGSISVDSRDKEGLQSIEPVYQLEVTLPSHRLSRYIGNRVHVRFNHTATPLAQQWLRSIRQLFLARFEV